MSSEFLCTVYITNFEFINLFKLGLSILKIFTCVPVKNLPYRPVHTGTVHRTVRYHTGTVHRPVRYHTGTVRYFANVKLCPYKFCRTKKRKLSWKSVAFANTSPLYILSARGGAMVVLKHFGEQKKRKRCWKYCIDTIIDTIHTGTIFYTATVHRHGTQTPSKLIYLYGKSVFVPLPVHSPNLNNVINNI